MQQRVEILRALYRDAQILVLDEPTAVLTAQEARDLFEVLDALKADGTGIVFISHKLNEVLDDLRSRSPSCGAASGSTPSPPRARPSESLARLMVGREVLLAVDKRPATPKEPVLEVRDLDVRDDRGLPAVRGALADGARRRDRRAGRRRRQRPERAGRGDHRAAPRRRGRDPRRRHRPDRRATRDTHGPPRRVATSPRTATGAGSSCSSRWPRTSRCATTTLPEMSRYGLISPSAHARARSRPARRVRRPRRRRRRRSPPRSPAATSRRCVSRARSAATRACSIAAQPTRGLDVGAIEFVHRRLVAERDAGRGVLLVSLEFEEVRSLADRDRSSSTRARSSASSRPTSPRRSSAS